MNFTEKDIENRKLIFDLVKNHFALDKTSLVKFEKNLYEPDIDEKYLKITDGKLKKEFNIPIDMLGAFDVSFLKFKKEFFYLVEKYNITYKNFLQNKVLYEKNEIKISKLVDDQEKKKKLLYILDSKIEYTDVENYKFVISLDYVDWFLCSTGENWKSCLDLENEYDGAYWSGLPGLIMDKNRCMLYVTAGQKKDYLNITADKMIGRSWGMLNEDDTLSVIRWFPKEYFSGMENLLPIEISEELSSKYKIDFLTRKIENAKCSVFIYLDYSIFDDGYIYKDGKSGFYFYKDDDLIREDLFYYKGGLKYLIKNNKKLNEYALETIICYECGNKIDGQVYEENGNIYCENCYDNLFSTCANCGEVVSSGDICYVDGEILCSYCYGKLYYCCEECSEPVLKESSVCYDRSFYCLNCAEKNFVFCSECGEACLPEHTVEINYEIYCDECYKKITKKGEPSLAVI